MLRAQKIKEEHKKLEDLRQAERQKALDAIKAQTT